MTGDTFHALAADPTGLNRDSLPFLRELNARYPYFRASRVLLAKNLKDENHIDQRRQLHLAAIYAADRSLLLDLMEGKEARYERRDLKEERGNDKYESDPAVAGFRFTQKDEGEKHEIGEEKTDHVEREHGEERVEAAMPEQLESETTGIEISEQENGPVEIGDETQETVLGVEETGRPLDLELIPEPVLYRIEDILLSEEEQHLPVQEQEAEPDELPFDRWLARLSGSEVADVSVTPAGTTPEPHRKTSVARPRSKDNLSLIADFLAAQPKEGSTKRAEFYKPSRAAERSNAVDLSDVSETLANIYETQGQLELAAKAFDALALKYPDKSSYFAARKKAVLDGE